MENNSSSLSSIEINVESVIGDASESTAVNHALGSCSQLNDEDNLVTDLDSDKEPLQLYKLVSIWKEIFEKLKYVSNYVTEKVNPNMGLAFLALTIQCIYQMASSKRYKAISQVNGVVVVLLLYGLLMPKYAGGSLALVAGVIIASLAALADVITKALGVSRHANGKIWLHKLMQNRKKVVEKVKNTSSCIMEKVTPNMGIAFLALTIQTIYQLKFPTPTTTREGKNLRKINGIATALLLYGLVIPKSAGGRIALLVGVLLASWVAIIISFTN